MSLAQDRSQILERVRDVAMRTFNCPRDSIVESTVAGDVKGWDSLSHTIFMMSIEDTFGVEFDIERVFSFDNVGDLVSALQERQAS